MTGAITRYASIRECTYKVFAGRVELACGPDKVCSSLACGTQHNAREASPQ